MKLKIFRHIFEKYSNIKFRETPCSTSKVAAWGWAGGWRETDIVKLTVAFPNVADAPEKCNVQWLMLYLVERLDTECGSLQNTHKVVAECAHIQHKRRIRYQKTYVSCSIHILHYNIIIFVSQRCFMVICISSCFTSLATSLLWASKINFESLGRRDVGRGVPG